MFRYRLYNRFCDFWREYAKFAVILIVFIVLGVVIGILGGNNVSRMLTVEEIKKSGIKYLTHSRFTFAAIFSANFFELTFIFGFVLLININIIFFPANHIYAVYRGYIIGYNCIIAAKIFGFSGVINIIFNLLPQEILLTSFFIIISSWCSERCLMFGRQGLLTFSFVEYKPLIKRIFNLYLIFIAVFIIVSLVVSIFAGKAVI